MDYSVNVLQFAEARASEIASLMDEINSSENKKKAWFQKLPHYMRRRGASQNPKRVPRKLREQSKQGKSEDSRKNKKRHKKSKNEICKPSQKTWLETHVWHAKRFKMETHWDYRIPIHSTDKKIGTSHRAAANRCMIEDLSYYCCIELIGEQNQLESRLSCLNEETSGHTFASRMFLDGTKEGHCFLYHPDSYPFKAIGPVTFLWEPLSPFASNKQENDAKSKISRKHRKLWIWCHPSFYEELVQVLIHILDLSKSVSSVEDTESSFPCKVNQKKIKLHFQKEERYSSQSNSINMNLLKNTFSRHRLIGPLALNVLSRVLRGVDVCTDSEAKKLKLLDSSWWTNYVNNENYSDVLADQKRLWDHLNDIQASYYVAPRSVIGLTVRDPRNSSTWNREVSTASDGEGNSTPLQDLDKLFTPHVPMSPLWEEDIRNEVTATKLPDHLINEERSKFIVTPDLGDKENKIPVIIIQHPSLNNFGSSWDLIAPMGWSLEFWRSYERNGALPAGLRDLHFVNLEAGRPNFPNSFPDTAACAQGQEALQHRSLSELLRHPKSQRPNFSALAIPTPFFMDWKTLVGDWECESQNPDSILLQVFKNSSINLENIKSFAEIGDSAAKSNDLSSKKESEKEFYVLRKLDGLSQLSERANKVYRNSKIELEKLKESIDHFMENSLRTQIQFSRSLILVKIKCLNKGTPLTHAALYLLSNDDLAELKRNPKFSGPTEPSHSSENQTALEGDEKCKNGVKSKPKNLKLSDYIKKPETVIESSSRKMIGCLSEGGFSSVCGHGIGIGHCTSIGFLVMLKQCVEFQLRPVVLWRNQHSFQFRIANIEPIENYL